jgi:hypothetical protein
VSSSHAGAIKLFPRRVRLEPDHDRNPSRDLRYAITHLRTRRSYKTGQRCGTPIISSADDPGGTERLTRKFLQLRPSRPWRGLSKLPF